MRWFTDEAYEAWADGDEASWDAMLAAYGTHIAQIAPSLPPDLRALAIEPRLHLHDARFISVVVDEEAGTIEMFVALGGFGALRLAFGGATFVEEDLWRIALAIQASFGRNHWGTTRTSILAQEIEIAGDGRFLLRLRLTPFHEFGILFRSFSLTEEPAPEDDVEPGRFRFADEPSSG